MKEGIKPIFFILIFFITFCLSSFSLANEFEQSSPPAELAPFIEKFIARNSALIGESEQLIFAINTDLSSSRVMIHAINKKGSAWQTVFPAFQGSIGHKGFAPIGEKREGDGKTPSGIFSLGIAFGYDILVETKMPYRQATEDDFWVDDPNSEDYNKWVSGEPNAGSWEKMKRNDDRYKYGVVIEYNTTPVVKGNGSAIFLHVWKTGEATSGCVSMSEEAVLKILGWLDPVSRPLIIMGAESELNAMSRAPDVQNDAKTSAGRPDMVDMKEINSNVIIDIKYATEDNFVKRRLYDSNTCFLRRSTANKLNAVQKELETKSLGLKLWDCYRPLAVQRTLWTILPDERYVANPKTGSRHNRACSVDATLVNSEGKEIQMPTDFDDFSPKAHHGYKKLPGQVIKNRELLRNLMKKAGFIPLAEEWWHYDDDKCSQYGLLDLSFEELLKN